MGCGASEPGAAGAAGAGGPTTPRSKSAVGGRPWPRGGKKESNAANMAAFENGLLRHKAPTFAYFDPVGNEGMQVDIREVKLPRAMQTHEVCFEPVTRCVFVSQQSSCVLVRLPLDANGILIDHQQAWRVGGSDHGDGIEGLHNISVSKTHPGCLWISLQYANQLMLIDVTAKHMMLVRQIMQVPTVYTDPKSGALVRVGGPHCMRECPVTGDVWVGLKGALEGAPCGNRKKEGTNGRSSCCDPTQLKASMAELATRGGFDVPIPDGWAVWRVTPSKYNPMAEDGAKGGTLYPCLKSPPMLDFDRRGHCYVPQDGVDTMLVIDPTSGECEQLAVPFPTSAGTLRITGPAVGTAPDGSVWMSLLGSYNALVRIDPTNGNRRTLYEFGGPPWCKTLHLIHLTFSAADTYDTYNRIYALASDLLDIEAVNAVVLLRMDDTWTTCLSRRIIPLPTQDCACHRIAFIDAPIPGRQERARSIAITELASSKLLQIKVHNITDMCALEETISTDSDGFEVRLYAPPKAGGEVAGAAC